MAGLQSVMTSYMLLILARHPFFGSGQIGLRKSCSPDSMTTIRAECGTHVDLLCTPTSISGKHIEYMSVLLLEKDVCNLKAGGTSVSQNGRLQCFIDESKVGLRLRPSKITDKGEYKFHIKTESSSDIYYASLQITGSEKTPNISLTLENKRIVCKVDGGCPVGQIEWSDNFGTKWTKSATVTEEDGLIVSTLHLSPLSIMKEYYCMVTYRLMENTETINACISTETSTGCNAPESVKSEGSNDSKTAISATQIILPICLLACGIMVLLIIWQRRRILQAKRQFLVPVIMNDTELQVLRGENGLQKSTSQSE